jgi:hypothetical protein
MDPDQPFRELPDEVTFTLDEVALLLFVADTAVEATSQGGSEHTRARRAQRLITSRLWPELGDLLRDDDEDGE